MSHLVAITLDKPLTAEEIERFVVAAERYDIVGESSASEGRVLGFDATGILVAGSGASASAWAAAAPRP